ncbi:MAG: aspartate/glutamate racemase family protein [Bacilli bacterium]|nr:aspartate/glutamate racemase family protein [Bacilli bacterium]
MKKNDFVIGVLGGMGTYATINLFKQYTEVFPAEKEWERPRIIIDNRCTMPSRVRAFLYNENVDQLVDEMSESMQGLVNSGCNKIILACNTSHLFLPQIYENVPGLKNKVIHIIECCVNEIKNDGVEKVYLLGSEGTIDSKIYQDKLYSIGVKCITPSKDEYGLLRDCIEAVKQNKFNDNVKKIFVDLTNRYDYCILGCTELPILYDLYKNEIKSKKIYDPLLIGLYNLKEEFDNE